MSQGSRCRQGIWPCSRQLPLVQRWRLRLRDFTDFFTMAFGRRSQFPPTSDDDRVYLAFPNGWIAALDGASGDLAWKAQTRESRETTRDPIAVWMESPSTSVVVGQDRVVVKARFHDGAGLKRLHALSAGDGSILWSRPPEEMGDFEGLLDGHDYFDIASGKLLRIDVRSGKVAAEVLIGGLLASVIVATEGHVAFKVVENGEARLVVVRRSGLDVVGSARIGPAPGPPHLLALEDRIIGTVPVSAPGSGLNELVSWSLPKAVPQRLRLVTGTGAPASDGERLFLIAQHPDRPKGAWAYVAADPIDASKAEFLAPTPDVPPNDMQYWALCSERSVVFGHGGGLVSFGPTGTFEHVLDAPVLSIGCWRDHLIVCSRDVICLGPRDTFKSRTRGMKELGLV